LWRDWTVQSVPLGARSHAVASMLFLRGDGVLLVGEAAARCAVVEPGRAARDFKRRMGDEAPVLLGEKGLRADELTGHLLRWVIDSVGEREGARPDHVMLTYPADWGDYRRGLLAGVSTLS
jgi:molecular chaperone DnaK